MGCPIPNLPASTEPTKSALEGRYKQTLKEPDWDNDFDVIIL